MMKDLKECTKSKMFIFVSNLISQRMKGKMTLRLHFCTKTFSDMSYSDEKNSSFMLTVLKRNINDNRFN